MINFRIALARAQDAAFLFLFEIDRLFSGLIRCLTGKSSAGDALTELKIGSPEDFFADATRIFSFETILIIFE